MKKDKPKPMPLFEFVNEEYNKLKDSKITPLVMLCKHWKPYSKCKDPECKIESVMNS